MDWCLYDKDLRYEKVKLKFQDKLFASKGQWVIKCKITITFWGHCCHLRLADFDLPPDSVTCARHEAESGKSKSKGLKWQQCTSKWILLLILTISYDYTNVGHCALCNKEKWKHCNVFLSSSHCNVFNVISSCFW